MKKLKALCAVVIAAVVLVCAAVPAVAAAAAEPAKAVLAFVLEPLRIWYERTWVLYGVVNTKALAVSNADATPKVITSRALIDAPVRVASGIVEVAAGDDDTSVFRFARLPSNAVIVAIYLWNDALTGGTVYNFGLHSTAEDGGAVLDADVFASSVDLSAARAASGPLNLMCEALNIDQIGKRLWELIPAFTKDPQRDLDVTATGATVGSGAGTIAVQILYVVG